MMASQCYYSTFSSFSAPHAHTPFRQTHEQVNLLNCRHNTHATLIRWLRVKRDAKRVSSPASMVAAYSTHDPMPHIIQLILHCHVDLHSQAMLPRLQRLHVY